MPRSPRLLAAFALLLSLSGCRREVTSPDPTARVEPAPSAPVAPTDPVASASPSPSEPPGAARRLAEAPPALAFPVGNKKEARKAADACWADPGCSADEAQARTRAAVLAGDEQYDCVTAYYGVGMPEDRRLARACFDHTVRPDDTCGGGGSPMLDRSVYAVMLIDGQAGPADIGKARALMAPCFQDMAATGIVSYADDDDRKPGADFCSAFASTTLAMNACGSIDADRDERKALLAGKELASGLDARGKALVGQFVAAWKQLAEAQASLAYDQVRVGDFVGTMSGQLFRGELSSMFGLEAEAFRSLGQQGEAGAAAKIADARKEALKEADAERKKLVARDEVAWARVRSAYASLAAHARGSQAKQAAESWVDERHARNLSGLSHMLD